MPNVTLSPSQQKGFDEVIDLLGKSAIAGLVVRNGCGRTTILNELAAHYDGHLIRMADTFDRLKDFHPIQFEESFADLLLKGLSQHETVIVDDLHIYFDLLEECYSNPRPSVLRAAFDAVLRYLEGSEKRLILGLRQDIIVDPLQARCLFARMPKFSEEDIAFLFKRFAGDQVEHLDFERIHRYVPNLTAHQMRYISLQLEAEALKDTETFLNLMEQKALVSNVKTEEVDEVTMDRLKGVEDVIQQMEVDIVVPMERPDLVRDLGLRPKRGVLLYGPPGTGKTTVGRALAHRLRSKFFLIDGTVISGTASFYERIQRVFQLARDNSPSIIFIDDCDLLFENDEDTGLYRYLLTKLDGLQSKNDALVTVILTAMNIGSLPPALIRSGRVELWLEMKSPNAEARTAIIRDALEQCPEYLREVDPAGVASQTKELTGADLKRIVTDAINLYGFDVAKEKELQTPLAYFEQAVSQLQKYRRQLEKAPAFTAAHRPSAKRARIGFLPGAED